jgi:hypothetical protein
MSDVLYRAGRSMQQSSGMLNAVSHSNIPADTAGQNYSKPEWIRIDEAVRRFGLSRSRLYQLIGERRIKSFCLRERNQIKGTRLISFDSLCEFFEKEAEAGGAK